MLHCCQQKYQVVYYEKSTRYSLSKIKLVLKFFMIPLCILIHFISQKKHQHDKKKKLVLAISIRVITRPSMLIIFKLAPTFMHIAHIHVIVHVRTSTALTAQHSNSWGPMASNQRCMCYQLLVVCNLVVVPIYTRP